MDICVWSTDDAQLGVGTCDCKPFMRHREGYVTRIVKPLVDLSGSIAFYGRLMAELHMTQPMVETWLGWCVEGLHT